MLDNSELAPDVAKTAAAVDNLLAVDAAAVAARQDDARQFLEAHGASVVAGHADVGRPGRELGA